MKNSISGIDQAGVLSAHCAHFIPTGNSSAVVAVDPATTFLNIDDVERETTYKRSTILYMVKNGSFPSPIKLGKRATRWVLSDVLAWKEKVIAASRQEVK